METVNKTRKRSRGRRKKRTASSRGAPSAAGQMFPAVAAGSAAVNYRETGGARMTASLRRQGVTPLHVACLHGELATVRLLLDSGLAWVNAGDAEGRRPLHMVLSFRSSPNTAACLRYLLQRDAAVNLATRSGQTPLHLAVSEGLFDCAEILVQAGADVLARDNQGHTAFDLARIWGYRKGARYLKSCMWQAEKKKEMEERTLVQDLYRDLVDLVKQQKLNKKALNKEKISEWADKKGLPLLKEMSPRVQESRYHAECLSPRPPNPVPSPQRPGGPTKPWSIFLGLQPDRPLVEPDLRDSVTLTRAGGGGGGRKLQISTGWDGAPRPAPDLPLDVLERALFPRAFPPRMASTQHFEPRDIQEVPHRGRPQGRSTSPWTEVAMHLAEALEPGHY